MKRLPIIATIALGLASGGSAQGRAEPAIQLWRLDCGRLEENADHKWAWQKVPTPTPCYLIAHGNRYLLWDAGVSARALDNAHPTIKLDRTITDQLAQIGLKPEQVEFVGISHYHGDHTGQATQFAKAKLLIGAGDFAALKQLPPPGGAAPPHFQPWIDGKAPVEALREDYDVFGDGRVVVLMTPGHTPGHSALLVKLATGPLILAGDLWFSHSDALRGTMPDFNSSRAETAASRERLSRMAEKLDALIILQHEPADDAKLPPFPQSAR